MKIALRSFFPASLLLYAALAVSIAWGLVGCLSPAFGDESFEYLQVVLQHSSKRSLTDYTAVIRRFSDETVPPDVWLPSQLLEQMKVQIKLNEKKDSFTLRLAHPADTLGVTALKTLAPKALDLDFKALSDDNRQHFNISGLERVSGISYILPEEAKGYEDALVVGLTPFMTQIPRWEKGPKKPQELKIPFNLVWDHVTRDNPDLSLEEAIPGVAVISPTWFALRDEKGALSGNGSRSYVFAARKQGYHVWALVSNGFNKDRTTKFLADKKAQDLFVAKMLAYAKIFDFDGINVDFESVANEDAKKLTAFVKKLTDATRTMGLKVSIDVMIPTKWSTCYERKELAEIVDYVAVMAYDEHWRTAPKAGSTASLPWVQNALKNTLADVPASKLLLGIPFYTREWEETKGKDGKVTVKSKTMAMPSVDLRLEETAAEKKWLEAAGQHYFQYRSDDKTYRVWVEDEKSITGRLALVKADRLAGAAFWRKGFEHLDIWESVGKALEEDRKSRIKK